MTEPISTDERPRLGVDPHVTDDLGTFDPSVFASIESAIRQEARSPFTRIRELPSPLRAALAVLTTVAGAIAIGTSTHRPDLDVFPVSRLVLETALLALAMTLCLVLAMRPIQLPAISRARSAGAIASSLLVALALALVPAPAIVAPLLGPIAPPDWSAGIPCLWFGTLVGIPAFLVARLLERGSASSVFHAAVAAGLAGNLALAIHCPNPSIAHRVSSHASLAFLFLGSLALAYAIARATRPESR